MKNNDSALNKNTKDNKPNKAGGMPSVTSTFKQLVQSKRVKSNIKNLLRVNKAGGFDCPGCAWGDSSEGMLHFCENGAKAIAWESTEQTVGPAFFKKFSVKKLKKQSDYWLEYQGRITHPMRYSKTSGHYEEISWQDAFQLIADKLNSLTSPNEVEFYTSGRASNEASYLYQLFGRCFGTNNFPDCSNMCHEASGIALSQSVGVGKGTVVLDDFYVADAIFVFGQNPGTNHPRMMNALRKAVKGGCKIVTVNNLREVALEKFASPQSPMELLTSKSVDISHLYLTPKLGGDMAFIRGIAKTIFERYPNSISADFIQTHTQGFEDYAREVKQTPWVNIVEQSGIDQAQIMQAANVFAHSKRVITTWAMGLTQHKHSVATIREISNLHLLTGQLGQAGAGLCPVRGHSNVQGNRTMGINEKPNKGMLDKFSQFFDHAMPQENGHNVFSALKALDNKESKVLIALGGNLAAAAPDTNFTHQAISNAELNVQISTKLNRTHLLVEDDALILPCLGRTEIDEQSAGKQKITVEDTFSMVHASAGNTPPISALCMSETAIVANIAFSTLGNKPVNWLELASDYDGIRDLIANTIDGFANFHEKLSQPGGFHLANSAAELQWNTANRRANFSNATLPLSLFSDETEALLQEKKVPIFTLQTMRSHDQYNTTIYGMDDRYRGVKGDREVLFMHPKDGKKLGLQDMDSINITSIWEDKQERKLVGFTVHFYDIPRGNVAGYYPELNPLVAFDSVGCESFTPTSKSVPVVIEKATEHAIPVSQK